MDCPCGGETKPLKRKTEWPHIMQHIDQCKACGREIRRLIGVCQNDFCGSHFRAEGGERVCPACVKWAEVVKKGNETKGLKL